MDKKKEIKEYLKRKFEPELPFNDLDPCFRYEHHDEKCREIAEDIIEFFESAKTLIK